jgi:hypothetical protein
MTQRRFLQVLTLLSLSTLTLGAAGCSQGHSPTEPEGLSASSATKSLAASPGKRHGADDPAGDDHGNHGGRGGQQQRPPRGGGELEGAVTTVDPAAGTLTLAGGKKIAVDGQTQWNRRGDLFSLQAVADAVAAAKPTRAEARGTRRADGVLLAQTIKAEIGTR